MTSKEKTLKFVSNVIAYAKAHDIRIGDIEETCGLSRGYLSRVQHSAKVNLTLEKAYRIANYLNMPVDAICDMDGDELIVKAQLSEAQAKAEKIASDIQALKDQVNSLQMRYSDTSDR